MRPKVAVEIGVALLLGFFIPPPDSFTYSLNTTNVPAPVLRGSQTGSDPTSELLETRSKRASKRAIHADSSYLLIHSGMAVVVDPQHAQTLGQVSVRGLPIGLWRRTRNIGATGLHGPSPTPRFRLGFAASALSFASEVRF